MQKINEKSATMKLLGEQRVCWSFQHLIENQVNPSYENILLRSKLGLPPPE